MVQRDQCGTYWGPKKLIFLIRDIDDATIITEHLIVLAVVLVDNMDSTTTKRKETNINSGVV